MDLRCAGNKLHGRVSNDDDWLEVKCSSRFCGAAAGTVVLHRFKLHTGEVETLRFADPTYRKA